MSQENDYADTRGPLGLTLWHSPPELLVDLVFVHGLKGGSIKSELLPALTFRYLECKNSDQ